MATLCSARTRARGRYLVSIKSALCASVLALGLGGCSSTPSILGGGDSAPQASLTQPSAATPVSSRTAKIQIAPIIGSPDNVARDLQTELSSAIGRNGLTVAASTDATGEYVLRGYIVAAREKTKAKISYIWDVTDQTGKRVHRITGEEVVEIIFHVSPVLLRSVIDLCLLIGARLAEPGRPAGCSRSLGCEEPRGPRSAPRIRNQVQSSRQTHRM